jgi:hypothetical protein
MQLGSRPPFRRAAAAAQAHRFPFPLPRASRSLFPPASGLWVAGNHPLCDTRGLRKPLYFYGFSLKYIPSIFFILLLLLTFFIIFNCLSYLKNSKNDYIFCYDLFITK